MRKCEWSKSCDRKATHKVLTKHGDFYVCGKHAKEADVHPQVRYIVEMKQGTQHSKKDKSKYPWI